MQIMLTTQLDTFLKVLLNTKESEISKHFHEAHGMSDLLNESHFKILRKCRGKFDGLVFEMLYMKKFKPTGNLNVQIDSIKTFCITCNYSFVLLFILVVVDLSFTHFLT